MPLNQNELTAAILRMMVEDRKYIGDLRMALQQRDEHIRNIESNMENSSKGETEPKEDEK